MATDAPTRPTGPPPSAVSTSPQAGSGSSKSSGVGGGGASGAEKRAVARENEAKRKAGKKYLEQAKNLDIQAKALMDALKNEFKRSRNQNLADISLVLNQQIKLLKKTTGMRAESFLTSAEDTDKATADTAEAGLSNLARERSDSLTAVLSQGAGETDALRAMLMSARNWHANASENNRAYFDTMNSINQGITDLNADAQTGFANMYNSAEAERERIWQDFFNRRSETFTQLGNIRGQQADYYASAKEMGVSPPKGSESAAKAAMKDAFGKASDEMGKSYKNKGLPKWVRNYAGLEQVERRQTNTNLAAAMTFEPVQRAEGATLRKWEAA